MKRKKIKIINRRRLGLTIMLVRFIFSVMMSTMVLTWLVFLVLHFTGALPLWDGARPGYNGNTPPIAIIAAMMLFSIFWGTLLSAFLSRKTLTPIRKVIDATHKVAEGDFSVRMELMEIHELEELSLSFNKMAHELSNNETLRRDFINNFSHEIKTPIVSVRGFAKLLKDGNLTESEREEYLDIIIAEADRLADLSTNILNLSKYENIEIITDKAPFRLDEQIRRAIVITEPKWSAMGIIVNVDVEETIFSGNEDLTQQVWLNLLDNAIKFSRNGGTIDVRLANHSDGVLFVIRDNGVGMDLQTQARLFDKFFQGNTSYTSLGNGLGLAIVKRICALCGGSIKVDSEPGKWSEFTVWLPNS